MGCLMETLNPHIQIIKKVNVKNMKVILIIIVSIALVYFIYKLCTLKNNFKQRSVQIRQ